MKAKKVMIIVVGFILALLLALGIMLKKFDLNDLKPTITEKITEFTGLKCHIDGNISWSLFPWLGIKINSLTLDDAPGGRASAFLTIGDMHIKMALWPLLNKQLNVTEVTLKDLVLHLTHIKGQTPNWRALKSVSKNSTETLSSTPRKGTAHNSLFSFDKIQIDAFRIQNGQVHFTQSERTLLFNNIHFHSQKIAMDVPIPIVLSFDLNNPKAEAKSTHKVKAILRMTPAAHLITLKEINWLSEIHDPRLIQKDLELAVHTAIQYNYNEDSLSLEKLNAKVGGAHLLADLQANHVSNRFDFNATLQAKSYQPTELMATVSAFSPLSLDLESARKFHLTSTLTGNLESLQGKINIQQLMISDIPVQQINANIHFENNTLQVTEAKANLLGGTLQSELKALLRATPEWFLQTEITRVPAHALLEKLHQKPILQGLFDLSLSLHTTGNDKTNLIKNSSGRGQFSLHNGQITGVDISYYLDSARLITDKLGKNPLATDQNKNPPKDRGYTPIDSLLGSFEVTAGIVNNDRLEAHAEQLGFNGKGKIDLNRSALDYSILASRYKMEAGERKKRNNVPLALKIVGNFDHPTVLPDIETYTHLYLQQLLQDKTQQLLENNGKDSINNKIEQELKKAFGF